MTDPKPPITHAEVREIICSMAALASKESLYRDEMLGKLLRFCDEQEAAERELIDLRAKLQESERLSARRAEMYDGCYANLVAAEKRAEEAERECEKLVEHVRELELRLRITEDDARERG